jgi:uncharacterized membrane protein YvbJ
MKNKIKCCDRLQDGNFCTICGCRLDTTTTAMKHKLNKVINENVKLKSGILYYIEAHYKKISGSTIQHSIKDLEKLIEE